MTLENSEPFTRTSLSTGDTRYGDRRPERERQRWLGRGLPENTYAQTQNEMPPAGMRTATTGA
jgi:hypothetical protein